MSDNMTVLRDSTKEPVNQFDIQLQLFMVFFKGVIVLSGGSLHQSTYQSRTEQNPIMFDMPKPQNIEIESWK